MSDRYSISVSEFAYNDIANIADYFVYEIKELETALSITNEIFDCIDSLDNIPFRYRYFYKEVRAYPTMSYLIFYTVDEYANIVYIVRVLSQKQEWATLLQDFV